jgi:hypothetical protein
MNQFDGSNIEKNITEKSQAGLSGPLEKKILTLAAAYKLIDRGKKVIQHDS